jgi:hypothetical protein
MIRRLVPTLVTAVVCGVIAVPSVAAQALSQKEREGLDGWYRRTTERTGRGEWGVAVGTMDGRVLWSMSPELALIPASTGQGLHDRLHPFARGWRFTTRDPGGGRWGLDPMSGRWRGTWALELGGDWTLDRTGRGGPTLA